MELMDNINKVLLKKGKKGLAKSGSKFLKLRN